MSIIETKLLQTDKIVAQDGDEKKEVNIPSLLKKEVDAYVSFNNNDASEYQSFNVSSVSKIGTGQQRINFIKPMTTDKYTTLVGGYYHYINRQNLQKESVLVYVVNSSGSYSNHNYVCVSIFGGTL